MKKHKLEYSYSDESDSGYVQSIEARESTEVNIVTFVRFSKI